MMKFSYATAIQLDRPAARKAVVAAGSTGTKRISGAFFTPEQKRLLRSKELVLGQVVSGDPRGLVLDFTEDGYSVKA